MGNGGNPFSRNKKRLLLAENDQLDEAKHFKKKNCARK